MSAENEMKSALKKGYLRTVGFLNFLSQARWFDWGVMAAILTVFLCEAYSHIDYHGLWGDEAYAAHLAMQKIPEIFHVIALVRDAPFYLLFLHFWIKVFGVSLVSIRSISVLCSAATLMLIYIFCKKNINRQTGFFACLLYIRSTFEIHYAVETRSYAMIGLFIMTALCLMFSLAHRPNWKTAVALGFIYALIVYTHYVAVLALVTQGIAAYVLMGKYGVRFFRFYILSGIVCVALVLPWLPNILKLVAAPGESWQSIPDMGQVNDLLRFYFFNDYHKFVLAIWYSAISLLVIVLANRKMLSWHYLGVFFILAVAPVALDYFISFKAPMFVMRYMMYALVGLFLFLGYLFSLIPISPALKVLVAIISAFIFLPGAEGLGAYSNEDWQIIVPLAKAERQLHDASESKIIIFPPYKCESFSYYWDRKIFEGPDLYKPLREQNIYGVNYPAELKQYMDPLPKEIIFINASPADFVFKKLDSAYATSKHINSYTGVNIAIYR